MNLQKYSLFVKKKTKIVSLLLFAERVNIDYKRLGKITAVGV